MKARDLRGVNLGGWLVIERWITPSIFRGIQGVDEHSLCHELGLEEAKKRLETHRQTFITEEHIQQISELGLNAVRVPLGYWLFDDTDGFVGGAYRYIDALFGWAAKYNIEVLLCLHGAPGSQNGWDHSGRSSGVGWHTDVSNMKRTLETVQRPCERYGGNERLYGLELLNEPHASLPLRILVQYYREATKVIRQHSRKRIRVVVSDAFRARQMIFRIFLHWFQHPILDQHLYQLFTEEDQRLDFDAHIAKVGVWYHELKWRTRLVPVIVGEWSAAMDERYQPHPKKTTKHFTQAEYSAYTARQRQAFEQAGCGWFYWTARVEDKGVWSLLDHPELLGK